VFAIAQPLARIRGLTLVLVLAACSGGGGGGSSSAPSTPPAPQAVVDPQFYSSAAAGAVTTPNEITSVTHHTLTLGATTLQYTATAGHMTALAPVTHAPEASFFYVAYTLDGASPANRPVTFFYNGGPGSASVWLHLGSFGPRRIATNAPSHSGPSPFPLVDNAETLLDISDLVFVDAVGSGLSTAVAPNQNRTFWGVDEDAVAFRDFIMRYIEVNNRASSPKYLYGESYGGPRTGVLASMLEAAGVQLRGVVLQSPAMDYFSNCDIRPGAVSCYSFLPSYAATGAWHGFASPSPGAAQLPDYMAQMRSYALTTYNPAVATFFGSGIAPEPLLPALEGFTGMPVAGWRANFNMRPTTFRTTLRTGTRYGRYDARVTTAASSPDGDPSSSIISPSFSIRINDYLVNELRYSNDSPYTMLSDAIQIWNWNHAGLMLPDTVPDLGAALALNPHLKILAVNGYHDVATPFFTTEQDLARLSSPNVQVRNYMGGHMTYLTDESRVRMKADLAAWYAAP
jgi:carboxypeptidase C (cathepsin A)